MSKNSSYERGKRWGYALFHSNLRMFGKSGLSLSDKTALTCRRYARDPSIKKTKSGKVLDADTRRAYQGITDGIYAAWRKFEQKFNK